MKAIVTGGGGFIGSHLVDTLLSLGIKVSVIDNFSSGNNLNIDAEIYETDICDPKVISLISTIQPDVVFHLAAQADVSKSVTDPTKDANVNINGTINLLQGCVETSVKKFIFSSTSAVYGNCYNKLIVEGESTLPSSFYGLSKLTAESYIKLFNELHGLEYLILRYANVYGPRQLPKGDGGVVSVFLERIRNGQVLRIHGDGKQTRDFINVKDVVSANIAALSNASGKTLNISTGESVSINELLNHLEKIHGGTINMEKTPFRLGDIQDSCLSNQLAKEHLCWNPMIPLSEGLQDAYVHYMS